MGDAMVPKERLCAELADLGPPDFGLADEPHAALAGLPLPVFITTNYDGFMTEALRWAHKDQRQRSADGTRARPSRRSGWS